MFLRFAPDPNPGGGPNPPAPTQPAPAPPADPRPADPTPPDPKPKPQPDADEIERRANERAAAIVAEREAAARKKAEAEKAKAEEEEARRRGDFEKLLNSEKSAREQAELTLRREQVAGRLRDHLAENHPDYAKAARYMLPLLDVKADTADADADRQIKAVVEQYVKDNPRAARGAGAPSAPPANQRRPADERPAAVGANGNGPQRLSPIARHF